MILSSQLLFPLHCFPLVDIGRKKNIQSASDINWKWKRRQTVGRQQEKPIQRGNSNFWTGRSYQWEKSKHTKKLQNSLTTLKLKSSLSQWPESFVDLKWLRFQQFHNFHLSLSSSCMSHLSCGFKWECYNFSRINYANSIAAKAYTELWHSGWRSLVTNKNHILRNALFESEKCFFRIWEIQCSDKE